MKSFKEYQKTDERKSTLNAEDLVGEIASQYNGKSSATMLKNILQEAEKSKRAGTLSNEEIDAFYAQFSPMLSSSQKSKLKDVVEKLKQI